MIHDDKLIVATSLARENLRFVTRGYLSIPGVAKLNKRLVMARKVMAFNPAVTLATCQQFVYDCTNLMTCMADDGECDKFGDVQNVATELINASTDWYKIAIIAEREARKGWDYTAVSVEQVAKWESRGGKYWVVLKRGRYGYYYCSNNSCGSVCDPNLPSFKAVTVLGAMLDLGRFLPDEAVLPMKRIW